LDLHILSPALFSMMVIMALATTLMTAPLIDRIHPSGEIHRALSAEHDHDRSQPSNPSNIKLST
jgi:hypothetical protein